MNLYFDRRQNHMVSFYHEIKKLAKKKWEEAGKPQGRDFDFWLSAEKELWNKYGNKIPQQFIDASREHQRDNHDSL